MDLLIRDEARQMDPKLACREAVDALQPLIEVHESGGRADSEYSSRHGKPDVARYDGQETCKGDNRSSAEGDADREVF